MKRFYRNSRRLFVLFSAVLLIAVHAARGSDTNFPGNVTVTSNLVVRGTLSVSNDAIVVNNLDVTGALTVTNIGPTQPNASIYISGADSDGDTNAGGVVITGGAGYDHSGDGYASTGAGNVVIVGGHSEPSGLSGNVILQGGSGYGTTPGSVILKNISSGFSGVLLQTANGTTRFTLQGDGTLNANGNALVNLGALQLGGTTITSWSKAGVQPGGSTSLTLTNGTVINGASFASITALSAPTISNVNVLTATTISNAVFVTSNVVVQGSLSVLNIVPNQGDPTRHPDVSMTGGEGIYGTGGGTNVNGGNVVITGGGGPPFSGVSGDVVLQGGDAAFEGSGGNVILKNSDNAYGSAPGGSVKLQTRDGTTRFYLQTDGTLNANNNAITGVGTLTSSALNLGSTTITNWVQVVSHVGPLGGVSMGSFTNAP